MGPDTGETRRVEDAETGPDVTEGNEVSVLLPEWSSLTQTTFDTSEPHIPWTRLGRGTLN